MADWFRESLVNRDRKGRFAKKAGGKMNVLMRSATRNPDGSLNLSHSKKVNEARERLEKGEGRKESDVPGIDETGGLAPEAVAMPFFYPEAIALKEQENRHIVEGLDEQLERKFPERPSMWSGEFGTFSPLEEEGALAYFDPESRAIKMNAAMYAPKGPQGEPNPIATENFRASVLTHEMFHAHTNNPDPYSIIDNRGYEEGLAEQLNRLYRKELLTPILGEKKAKLVDEFAKKNIDPKNPYNVWTDALEEGRGWAKMEPEEFYRTLYDTPLAERPHKMFGMMLDPYRRNGEFDDKYYEAFEKAEELQDKLQGGF